MNSKLMFKNPISKVGNGGKFTSWLYSISYNCHNITKFLSNWRYIAQKIFHSRSKHNGILLHSALSIVSDKHKIFCSKISFSTSQ